MREYKGGQHAVKSGKRKKKRSVVRRVSAEPVPGNEPARGDQVLANSSLQKSLNGQDIFCLDDSASCPNIGLRSTTRWSVLVHPGSHGVRLVRLSCLYVHVFIC